METSAEFAIEQSYRTDRSSPSRWILSHVRRHGWLLPVLVIGAFGNAALAGVVPVIVGDAFDRVGALAGARPGASWTDLVRDGAAAPPLAWAAVWIVVSQVVRAFLQLGRNFASEVLAQRFERDARSELYASLLGKSMAFHSRRPVGEIMARATNDVREINLMLNPGINLVVGSGMFLLVPILFAPRYHPSLVAVPAVFTVSYAWALRAYLRELAPITQEARTAFGRMNARLTEAVDGIEVLKGASREGAEEASFASAASRFRDAFVRQGYREARFLPLLLWGIAIGVGFFHSVVLHAAGALSTGDVVAYAGLLQLFGFPTFVSLFAYAQVSSGIASAARLLELMNEQTDVDENVGGHAAPMRGVIDLQSVCFGYSDDADVIDQVSFHADARQIVALVGETGSGKSTIARLLNRTYDVRAGSLRIDGIDVRDWHLESLRRQIAIIEQDPFLLSRSIAENIAFGKADATRAAIEAAAEAAQADDFVRQLPEGYDTVIGERGVTLSGGQRQRIAIARALLSDPRILVLDDATSAIDSATEDAIQRAMWKAAEGRTTLLITHRLSQIRWADQVVVLRRGRVVAQGTHDDLLAGSPIYQRLFRRYDQRV